MPRLKLQGADGELSYELPQNGRYRVGRSKHSDLQLNHPSVSEQHCEIYVDPMVVMLTDLGSTNGTFLDGNPIQKSEVSHGQLMHVGAYALRFELETQEVVVPAIQFGHVERPTTLASGAPCCFRHSQLQATMKCSGCQRTFCAACIRQVGLVGSAKHYHCPECHKACHAVIWNDGRSRSGFLGGIVNAIKKLTGGS